MTELVILLLSLVAAYMPADQYTAPYLSMERVTSGDKQVVAPISEVIMTEVNATPAPEFSPEGEAPIVTPAVCIIHSWGETPPDDCDVVELVLPEVDNTVSVAGENPYPGCYQGNDGRWYQIAHPQSPC